LSEEHQHLWHMKTVRRSPAGPDSRQRPDISGISRQAAGMNAEYDLSNSADGIPGNPRALTAETPSHPRDHRTARADHRTPVFVIKSRQRTGLELRDLWSHRELFYILAWRDVKVRYKQSALGVTWVVLQPLITMMIFTLLFGRLARIPSEGEPYAIFSYAGLLPWTFFSSAVAASANSLVNSSNIITKVYFPRLLIPAAAVGAALVDLAIASLLLVVIMPLYGASFHFSMMMYFPLAALTAITAAGVGIYTSALNVKYRDIRHALPFVIQIWMYVTPVIYPVSFLPQRWRWLLGLNPLSGIIEGFRAAIFGHPLNWQGLAVSTAIAGALFITGAYSFRRLERQFADVI
jgi:lipopolysaccharide transport system permease protein